MHLKSRRFAKLVELLFICITQIQLKKGVIRRHFYRRLLSNVTVFRKYLRKFMIQNHFQEISTWEEISETFLNRFDLKIYIHNFLDPEDIIFSSKTEKSQHKVHIFYNSINSSYQFFRNTSSFRKIKKQLKLPTECKFCGFKKHNLSKQFFSRQCENCFQYFRDYVCFINHSKVSPKYEDSFCNIFLSCPCGVKIKKTSKHICNLGKICYQCQTYYHIIKDPKPHNCYIRPLKRKVFSNDFKAVFFDIESRTSTQGRHIPTLICATVYNIYGTDQKNYQHIEDLVFLEITVYNSSLIIFMITKMNLRKPFFSPQRESL